MKVALLPLVLCATLVSGCGSDSLSVVNSNPETDPTEPFATDSASERTIAGATFVSLDSSLTDSQLPMSTLTFTSDTVTFYSTSGGVEQGTYTQEAGSQFIATLPDRSLEFVLEGNQIEWESVSFQRATSSLFDSQESLEAFFDGDTYRSVEDFPLGEPQIGAPTSGPSSTTFQGNEILLAIQDTIDVGVITFVDDFSFLATFPNRELTGVVLENNQLVLANIVYELVTDDSLDDNSLPPEAQPIDPENPAPPESESQLPSSFNSQATLIEFLNGSSYSTVQLLPIGAISSEAAGAAMGFWQLSFMENSFDWSPRGILEEGTIAFAGQNAFTLILEDRRVSVQVEGEELIIEGLRYARQPQAQPIMSENTTPVDPQDNQSTGFNSQATLQEFLNDSSYRSVLLLSIGARSPDASGSALGYWQISFMQGSFTWRTRGMVDEGTIVFSGQNAFTLVLDDRRVAVLVEGEDLIIEGVRYVRQ